MTELATDAQKNYMAKLGLIVPANISKLEAKGIINEAINKQHPPQQTFKKTYNNNYSSNSEAKDKSIVSQVLLKCWVELKSVGKETEPKLLVDTYKEFYKLL